MELQDLAKLQMPGIYYSKRDGIYAEYTYNGDKQELYEDVYKKLTNTYRTEE